jgi:hypothetical protein
VTDLVQGEAVIMLGPDPGDLTDYSCFISEFVINDTRTVHVKAPSFGSPAIEEKAAAYQAAVTMSFLAVPSASSGLLWELDRAKRTRTGELYFEWKGATGSVSATNPKRTGYLVVTAINTGAAMAQPRRQSQTFPARSVSGFLSS